MIVNEHNVIISWYYERTCKLNPKSKNIYAYEHYKLKIIYDSKTGERIGEATTINGKDRWKWCWLSFKHSPRNVSLKTILLNEMRRVRQVYKDNQLTAKLIDVIIAQWKRIGEMADDPEVLIPWVWFQIYIEPTQEDTPVDNPQVEQPTPVVEQSPKDSDQSKPRKPRSKKVQASEASEVPSTPAPEFTKDMEIKCINPGIFGKLQMDKVYKAEELVSIQYKWSTIYMYKINLGYWDSAQFNVEYFTPL